MGSYYVIGESKRRIDLDVLFIYWKIILEDIWIMGMFGLVIKDVDSVDYIQIVLYSFDLSHFLTHKTFRF